jgi:hypothetical protein
LHQEDFRTQRATGKSDQGFGVVMTGVFVPQYAMNESGAFEYKGLIPAKAWLHPDLGIVIDAKE